AAAAGSIGAAAYAAGPHIHFGAGNYDPSSSSGQRLIAHEVAHTVQQGSDGGAPASGGVQKSGLAVSAPSDPHEAEGESCAQSFVAGGAPVRSSIQAGSVSRSVIHRDAKPDGAVGLPKSEAQFNRGGVEAVRGRASAMMLAVGLLDADAKATIDLVKRK